MKKILLSIFILQIIYLNVSAQMTLEFNTNLSEGTTITLPLRDNVNVTVDWDDETEIQTITTSGNHNHTYANEGIYSVKIYGQLRTFGNGWNGYENSDKLQRVISFGELGLKSLSGAFYNATNLTEVPNQLPSTITSLYLTFGNASKFNYNIGTWDVSHVTNMSYTFYGASIFNQDISSWNVSNVTNMCGLFYLDSLFNQDIGSWDVSKVTDMSHLFDKAIAFNQDIGSWNTSKVKLMFYTFGGATSFKQNLNSWVVDNVTNMEGMFNNASSFNSDLSNWNVGNVTAMAQMFNSAYSFNSDISSWDVSKVTSLSYMFFTDSLFNQNIGSWDVGNVTDMSYMFYNAVSFNQKIGNWDVHNVTNMSEMFRSAIQFNQDIGDWDVAKVEKMSNMFKNATLFNQYIGNWNTCNVNNMSGMFYMATSFNTDIGSWDVGNVTNMSNMFYSASCFNKELSSWNVSNVTNMSSMFQNASSFNKNLGYWDVSNVTSMYNMFRGSSFNQNLKNWDISIVASASGMFQGCTLSTSYYDEMLINWSKLDLQHNLSFHGGSSKYSQGPVAAARLSIINNFNWTITDGGESTLPAIATIDISNVTPVSASSGGVIYSDGGYSIVQRGIVWDTLPNPTTVKNSGIINVTGSVDTFQCNLTGLALGTTYYVRAFATNTNGTDYGNNISFIASQELTISGSFTVNNKTYDGGTYAHANNNNLLLNNIIAGNVDVTVSSMNIFLESPYVNDSIPVHISNINLEGNDAFKYYISLVNAPISIASVFPKELTISGPTLINPKVYDGNTTATLNDSIALVGIIVNDSAGVYIKSKTIYFNNPDVGENKPGTISIVLDGEKAYNYYITDITSLQGNITPKDILISGSFTVLDKEYDGLTTAFIDQNNLFLTGVLNNDTVDLVNVVAVFDTSAIGENILVEIISAKLEGPDSGNYTLQLTGAPTTSANILEHKVSVIEVQEYSRIYPNPFSEKIYINNSSLVSGIKITDILGQTIIEINSNDISIINTENLTPGVYFVSVEYLNNHKECIRMIKQ